MKKIVKESEQTVAIDQMQTSDYIGAELPNGCHCIVIASVISGERYIALYSPRDNTLDTELGDLTVFLHKFITNCRGKLFYFDTLKEFLPWLSEGEKYTYEAKVC